MSPRSILALACCLVMLASACGNARVDAGPAAMGEDITDGQFTFQGLEWECGAREVSRGLVRMSAIGTYCFLTIRVMNTGDAGRRFVATSQRLLDVEGRRLDIAQQETLLMNPGEVGNELNPGLAMEVVLVFDVADIGAIEAAELHDAVLSRGVRISLGG